MATQERRKRDIFTAMRHSRVSGHCPITRLLHDPYPGTESLLEEGRRELEGRVERQKSRLAEESNVEVHLEKQVP